MKNGNLKAKSTMLIAICLIVATGCSNNGNTKNEGSTASPSSEATSSEATAAPEKKENMKLFMTNSGLTMPDGTDPSNNEFINVVENYANVDLEVTVPEFADYATKLNLLLASGNLPDIVHTNNVDPVNAAAEKGAFIDLKPYYDNSPEIQKWITPEMMEMASYKGKYYRLPMATGKDAPQGGGNYINKDLLDKYNDGQYPDSVEGYVELLRKIKAANPDAVPLTAYQDPGSGVIFLGGQGFFQWYGARPNEFRVQDGKVISTFVLPEYREAVELYRQLYKEGLLDPGFATNDWGKWYNNLNKDALLVNDTADQLMPLAAFHKQSKGTQSDTSFRSQIAFAPPLKTYPSVLKDVKYTYMKKGSPIIFHGIYISSKTKDPERTFRVLEGFASDELNEAIFWGKEGSEYTVENGKRVPNSEKLLDASRYWSLQLSIVRGFSAGAESKAAQQLQTLGQEEFDYSNNSLKIVADQAEEVGVNMFSLIPVLDEIALKLPESNKFLSAATVDAIMGKISMEQFDKKVGEYSDKYSFIADAYTKYMNENKAKLDSWGVKEVNW
jgi:putative aldouronate transport system substrate-binding protein